MINVRNSKQELFPTAAFLFCKINYELKLKKPRTEESTQPLKLQPLHGPGKTVDVYDDLCNVLVKLAIGITCLPPYFYNLNNRNEVGKHGLSS